MTFEEVKIGRKVIYTPKGNYSNKVLEEGVITSKNSKFIFVRYGSDCHSKSTDPEDLAYSVQK